MKSSSRTKSRWLLAASLLVALSLAGCSGSGSGTDAATGVTGAAVTVDPGAPPVAVGSSGASPLTQGALVNPELPATSVTTTGSTTGTTTVTTADPATGTTSVATTDLTTGATTVATTNLATGAITTTNTTATVTTNPTTGVTTVATTNPTTGATTVAATNLTTGTATVTTTSAAPGAAPVVTTVATPVVIASPAAAKALVVQGNLVGDANAALTGAPPVGVAKAVGAAAAPASVPITQTVASGQVSVVLVDETGNVAASQTVTAADGKFLLVAPTGHTYALFFRDTSPTGKTIAPLFADKQTGRISFSLPDGSPDKILGDITLDSLLGKAWTWADPALAVPTVAFPFPAVEWRGTSDVPTERAPSPLFGAQPFTQAMVLFEEFGPEAMPAVAKPGFTPFPQPISATSGPDPASLEAFLAQDGVAPYPTRLSNVIDQNPWKGKIETFLGHKLVSPVAGAVAGPAEGRPSGEDWAHQSFDPANNGLFPQKFYKTAQAPARTNGGFRDALQRHGYSKGEFGPGGLYHNVAGVLPGTTNGVKVQLHPNMPVQNPNSIWTFDGTLPPKLLQARYGEPVMMRHYNALPIDETANNGFGMHTITTHEHNGHSPGESDGVAAAFFFPGEFYDYRWPLQFAGFSNNNNGAGAVNFGATDVRAATPCEPGETLPVLVNGILTPRVCQNGLIKLPGDWRETMSTHWFHDHMLDFTSQNVYKGNAVMMNYYSALDRGNEAINDGVNLRFPSGSGLNWGNRDYDMNLVLGDKATDATGQLMMNTTQHNGWLGDMMTVNWQYKPFIDVRARSYRFRILNGSVSRIMALAMVQQVNGTTGELPGPPGSGISYNRVPFHMIANDGNILEHAVAFDGKMDVFHDGKPDAWKGQLPSQTIAERYDIVVNFGKNGIQPGDKVYFVNIMEHQDGKGTKSKVPLGDILSEKYKPTIMNGRWVNGDPGVGKFMELRVKAYAGTDLAMNPADFEPGKLQMLPLPIVRGATTADTTVNGVPVANAIHHTFEFVHSGGQGGHGEPWQIKVDGGQGLLMDPHRIQAIEKGDVQVWTIKGTGGWTHPVHIHFEEGIILSRGGKAPPEWERWGKKDMYRIGPENDSTGILEIAYRSRDFLGEYVQHCHNTMHEDHAMLLRWDAVKQGAALLDTPMPTFDGVFFEPSFPLTGGTNSNDKAIIGDGIGPRTRTPNTF